MGESRRVAFFAYADAKEGVGAVVDELADAARIHAHDLAGHDCIRLRLPGSRRLFPFEFGRDGRDFEVEVQGRLILNEGAHILWAACAGLGLAQLFEPFARADLRAGRLVALDLDHPATELDGVFAVWPGDRRPPARLRAFLDWAADRFGPVPPWDPNLADAAATPRAN